MEKGTLYLMRHGQTDWNLKNKLQGGTDVPLNDAGRQMAREAAERYKDTVFDICYSSPLRRALETAQLVLAGRDVPIIADGRLREMGFGAYEGTEGYLTDPANPAHGLFSDPAHYKAGGGAEPLEALFARTGEFLDAVAFPELRAGKRILVVGHGAMNLSIINRICRIPVERYWERLPGNCELVELSL